MVANNAASSVEQLRAGLYAWAGPDTIRMTRVKYGKNAKTDDDSFLRLYDRENLRHAADILGVTDMWVTYSWGFAPESERAQRTFLRNALPGFRAAGIRTHAYVQGLNAVTSDIADHSVFCRTVAGKLIPYSRGRSLLCANNPAAREIILRRVADACDEEVTGVFMDNILFGSPPLFVRSDYLPPFGCACRWCDDAYRALTGQHIPLSGYHGADRIHAAITVRTNAVTDLLRDSSAIAHATGKQFGVNLYDPLFHTPELYMGYALADIDASLDYRLIENHALSDDGTVSNGHLRELTGSGDKPTFVVSYKLGIGRDAGYTQSQVDAIFSDARARGYAPCLKASEYVTNGRWHALDLRSLHAPSVSDSTMPDHDHPLSRPLPSTLRDRMMGGAGARTMSAVLRGLFRSELANRYWSRSSLYLNMLRCPRRFDRAVWNAAH